MCWRFSLGFQIPEIETIQVYIIKNSYQKWSPRFCSIPTDTILIVKQSRMICNKQNSTLLWNYKLQNEFEISYLNRKLLLPRWEPFRKLPNSSSCVPCLVSKTDNIQEQVKQLQHIPLSTLARENMQSCFNKCCFSRVYISKLSAYNNILEENISSSNWWNISIKPLF